MDLILVDTPPYKMAEKEKDSERRENGGIREKRKWRDKGGEEKPFPERRGREGGEVL